MTTPGGNPGRMDSRQANCGQTFFRGRMSKVLRLSIRDLPSFAAKSPATMSILKVTPNHSAATQHAIEYVQGLLLQSSQALAQNQQTIKELLAERDKFQAERDSRPTLEEYRLLQEQLDAQREISQMDRAQIKQLQTLSEQQDHAIFQSELRFHDVNQSKNEMATKMRSLTAAQIEHNGRVMALERQLQMSKEKVAMLSDELRNKADDLQCCHERLQVSIAVQNELKKKVMSSLNHSRADDCEQLDCELLLRSLYSHVVDDSNDECVSNFSCTQVADRLRSALDHYWELRKCSTDAVTSHIKRLCSYIPGDLTEKENDPALLIDALEEFLRGAKERRITADDYSHLEKECSELHIKLHNTETKVEELSSRYTSSEGLASSLQGELKRSQSQYVDTRAELEKLRCDRDSLEHQLKHVSPSDGIGECISCSSRKETFETLENQLLLLSQEFESLQREMVEMRSRSAAHGSVIRDKDVCIAKLQEDIRILSEPEIIRRSNAPKENREPLSRVYK